MAGNLVISTNMANTADKGKRKQQAQAQKQEVLTVNGWKTRYGHDSSTSKNPVKSSIHFPMFPIEKSTTRVAA